MIYKRTKVGDLVLVSIDLITTKVLVSVVTFKQGTDEWVLDPECTFYMFPRLDFFQSYTKFDGG